MNQTSSNPVFNDKLFQNISSVSTASAGSMTIDGTVNRSVISILITMTAGYWAFGNPTMMNLALPCAIIALIMAIVISLKPTTAPYTVPLYAAIEGLFLGAVSTAYAGLYDGIIFQAVALTFGVLFGMLMLYKSGAIKVTDKLRSVINVGISAIFLVYMASFALSFFGKQVPMIHEASPMGIGFSLLVIGFASFKLLLDFDFIEQTSNRGAPKYMEWYGAFALLVTLVWIYFEILRLLAKISSRD